jgi:hypothetical protein
MSENDASRIVNDNSKATLQIAASLTDDSRGVIYNSNMFTVQATDLLRHELKDNTSGLFSDGPTKLQTNDVTEELTIEGRLEKQKPFLSILV